MLRATVKVSKFDDVLPDMESDVAGFITSAMIDTAKELVEDLRDQVRSAGLGGRLANTWRGTVYPDGRAALNPAGYVWTNAPAIIDAFSRGATIRPVNGASYLWIPTKNVPRARGRVSRRGQSLKGGPMTPDEVEGAFDTEFIVLKGKTGGLLAFIDVLESLNGRGYRPATRRRTAQGRRSKPILMFVLRRTVRAPKLLDLDGAAAKAGTAFERNLDRRWR